MGTRRSARSGTAGRGARRLAWLAAAALLPLLACPARQSVPEPRRDLGTGAGYASSAWPTIHRDSRNSDFVPFTAPAESRVAWQALDGAALFIGPTLGPEGHLYVTSGRGAGTSHLHAFDRSGALLWEAPRDPEPGSLDSWAALSAVVVDDAGNLFVGDGDQLFSFTPDGAQRFAVSLRERGAQGFFVSPILVRGLVGGVTTDGLVLLFDRDTGALARPPLRLPGRGGPEGAPPPAGLWAGGLFDPSRVAELWNLIWGWQLVVANTPAVDPTTGRLFITAAGEDPGQGVLYGIDVGEAAISVAFAAPLGAGSGTSPALSPDGTLVYGVGGEQTLVAIDAATGASRWQAPGVIAAASPAVGPDGTVYSYTGSRVVAFDGATGAQRWTRDLAPLAEEWLPEVPFGKRDAALDTVLSVAAGRVLGMVDLGYRLALPDSAAGGEPGARSVLQPRRVALVALDAATGERLGATEVRDTSGALVVPDADGRIYLSLTGTASSIVHAGLDPQLPEALRSPLVPQGGLVALEPRSPRAQLADAFAWAKRLALEPAAAVGATLAPHGEEIARSQLDGALRTLREACRSGALDPERTRALHALLDEVDGHLFAGEQTLTAQALDEASALLERSDAGAAPPAPGAARDCGD